MNHFFLPPRDGMPGCLKVEAGDNGTMHFEASPGANMGGSKHLFGDVSVYTWYILTKTLQTLKKKAPSHPGFLVFTHQELPSVRLLEGDVHWTNDNSPSLEPTEIAAVMTTRGCGPGNQVTRQCVKAAKNYRTLDLVSEEQCSNILGGAFKYFF